MVLCTEEEITKLWHRRGEGAFKRSNFLRSQNPEQCLICSGDWTRCATWDCCHLWTSTYHHHPCPGAKARNIASLLVFQISLNTALWALHSQWGFLNSRTSWKSSDSHIGHVQIPRLFQWTPGEQGRKEWMFWLQEGATIGTGVGWKPRHRLPPFPPRSLAWALHLILPHCGASHDYLIMRFSLYR